MRAFCQDCVEDGHGTAGIMRRTGKAKDVIWRWPERGRGLVARQNARRPRIPPLDPEVAEARGGLDVGRTATERNLLDRFRHGQWLGTAHLVGPWPAAVEMQGRVRYCGRYLHTNGKNEATPGI